MHFEDGNREQQLTGDCNQHYIIINFDPLGLQWKMYNLLTQIKELK